MLRTLLAPLLLAVAAPAPALAETCPATSIPDLGRAIAWGHAFDKHRGEFIEGRRIGGLAFPDDTVDDKAEFAGFIAEIVEAPDAARDLRRSRRAFWDEETGTVVISNFRAGDCGTAFRPHQGRAYFEGLE